jgi:HSP20 family protein
MGKEELKVQEKQVVHQDSETTKPGNFFVPAVDIFETEEQVTVIAEMPGVDNTGVDVSLEDDVLTIHGYREENTSGDRMILQEYENGGYQRKFTVSESIDQDKIQASMSEGLLRVILPKAAPAQPRKIEVQAG